ncbi:hypothetical protein ACOSP7_002407 [Xanthoceras sorbifolium]|uniref:Vacuolar protein sorting-associated protein Ist1 n=1 Tax=Xanthoceras sorbifolium TaxID=99658 RepID=A0ABQ8IJP4_9ROSI|nr:hypothetical protein JRO89_XS01G0173100 [Xanthoceras sorbifolium]
MFGILFGWRKASKCKKLIKQVQCRLKLLKNKRCSIVRLLREDVAELIKIGNEQIAFNRAEQLFKDENTMVVYELLDNFCEFIRMNLSYIRKRKDCPNDINEAVSSLIFASSRCGDLPELRGIRKLFEERYGQRFAMAATELFPGNLVNHQIKEKLSLKSVPDDMKHQLLDEIAKDYCLRPEILAIEYASELQQVQENNLHHELHKTCGYKIEVPNANNAQDLHVVDSSMMCQTTPIRSNPSHSHRNSDAVSTSISSSMIQQSSSDILESPIHSKAGKLVENFARCDPYESGVAGDHTRECQSSVRNFAAITEHRKERIMTGASSSESLPQFPEDKVVYLDDIEEFQSSTGKNGDCQDQDHRLFKFKPSVLPKTETAGGWHERYTSQYESGSENSNSKSSRTSLKASGKRSRRRSLSRENSSIKDVECKIYYEKPCKISTTNKHSSHPHRKHQKKTPAEEGKQSFNAEKKRKQVCCVESGTIFQCCNFKHDRMTSFCHCHFNRETHGCSLEHSCCCIGDLKYENFYDHLGCCHLYLNTESEEEMGRPTLIQRPRRRSCDNRASEYNVFTYPNRWPNEQIQKTKGKAKESDSPSKCAIPDRLHPKETTAPLTGKRATPPPYLTVKTMPPERPKETRPDNIQRCNSLPLQHPDHVHPKLPDYDDIAAKFMALKKELLQNNG